ncbi:hypothetical protein [Streptomyces parvus]|uniref:hypothetical protein n=1 Tax=Streptomyces parvus TaxID=66428 RepID=UPI0021014201|nr:hypothetical protein [Streptomyces parvus]MCQ1576394.1 hypothetical protein [Streptomyces parvus]
MNGPSSIRVSALRQRLDQVWFGLGDVDAQRAGCRAFGPGQDVMGQFRVVRVDLEHQGVGQF